MSETSTLIGYNGRTIGREELALVPTPPATETHRPIPHHEIVQALIETLGFRHIGVIHDEYAVSPDGMKAFGVLDLATEMEGCRFSIGLRNSHDKSMRLAMTCGYPGHARQNQYFTRWKHHGAHITGQRRSQLADRLEGNEEQSGNEESHAGDCHRHWSGNPCRRHRPHLPALRVAGAPLKTVGRNIEYSFAPAE